MFNLFCFSLLFQACWNVLPAVFPSNFQMALHLPEFLRSGYRSSIGNVETKFPLKDPSRKIAPFSVGQTDGQCKICIMYAIVAFTKELQFSDEDLKTPQLSMVLSSFGSIRCSYEHFTNPAHFFLHSLRHFLAKKCKLQAVAVGFPLGIHNKIVVRFFYVPCSSNLLL